MLHVFHVDGGRTLHLDVGLVTGPVSGLQAALAELPAVPVPDQVLLISGGSVLEPNRPLSSFAPSSPCQAPGREAGLMLAGMAGRGRSRTPST